MRGFGQVQASGGAQQIMTAMPIVFKTAAVDPAMLSNLVEFARSGLRRSANLDLSNTSTRHGVLNRICKTETTARQCMNTLARYDNDSFRVGLRSVFDGMRLKGQKTAADQLVPMLDNMLMVETGMSAFDARAIVLRDYMAVFKTMPGAPTIPGKIPSTPLPPPGGFIAIPRGFGPGSGGASTTGQEGEAELAPVADNGKPPYLLYAGVAAVALVGIGYLATRPKS